MKSQFNAIIILGGGRHGEDKPEKGIKKGDLTTLSISRLNAGVKLFKNLLFQTANIKIFALGENKSTYAPTAIEFDQPGCFVRKQYLLQQQIKEDQIIEVNGGRDTIDEAFACRSTCQQYKIRKVLLVTSKTHAPRALWIFKRIFGDEIQVKTPEEKYLCKDTLNPKEEHEIFELTKQFFKDKFGENNPIPDQPMKTWFEDNQQFYEAQAQIHRKYLKEGIETNEAYMGSGQNEL